MKFSLTVLNVSFTRVFPRITGDRELKLLEYLIWTLFVCWENICEKCEHNKCEYELWHFLGTSDSIKDVEQALSKRSNSDYYSYSRSKFD